jgi:flagellar protein FliL
MADDTATADGKTAPAPKAGGSKLLTLLVAANLAASGAGVFLGLRHKPVVISMAAPPASAERAKPGPVVALDPFVVNLNEAATSRYLKATFEIEVTGEKAAEELAADKRGVRDEVLRYLSSLSVAETLGEANKDKIQTEIVSRVDRQLGGGKVRRLYFSDFVVQ